MDEILIEDKKYVSSKRAAKMTGYAKDYIGQLCREGRVPARLVGRSWYVLETAIQDHRFPATPATPATPASRLSKGDLPKKSWESPHYEAFSDEALPSVNRLQHTETPPENLQDSWRAWFEHVGNVEPADTAASPERLEEEEAPPVLREQAGEIEIERDVQIPIHTIYELPPEELLPHRTRVESTQGEQEDQSVPVEVKAKTRLGRGVMRTIQIAGVALAIIISFTAIIGSGYVDKYIISDNPVSILAGVAFYNR